MQVARDQIEKMAKEEKVTKHNNWLDKAYEASEKLRKSRMLKAA